jgi:hypothetical protein
MQIYWWKGRYGVITALSEGFGEYHESNTVHIRRSRTINWLGRAPLERWEEGPAVMANMA